MNQNHTTALPSPPHYKPGYLAFIPLLLLTLGGCTAALVYDFRRRSRLDEMRHRLIPLYRYDPAEEEEWGDADEGNEEQELAGPLYKEAQLLLTMAHEQVTRSY